MSALRPSNVNRRNVFVIAKQKRIRIVLIAEICQSNSLIATAVRTIKIECGIPAIELIGTIRPWNLENIESIILVDVDILRAEPQPRIADVAVH